MEYEKLTDKEYKEGVKSGKLLHVYNTETKQAAVVTRDAYYSPETRKKLVNLEHPNMQKHPNVRKFLNEQIKKVYG